MSKRCDQGDFERRLENVLPEAAPRLDPATATEMRRRLTNVVIADAATTRWRLAARRSVVAFAVGSSLLGSVSVAAAMSRPGEPAYQLKQVFNAVRDAVAPERTVVKKQSPVAPRPAEIEITKPPVKKPTTETPAAEQRQGVGNGKRQDAKGRLENRGRGWKKARPPLKRGRSSESRGGRVSRGNGRAKNADRKP